MKFTNPSIILPLFVGMSAALVARATKDVYSDVSLYFLWSLLFLAHYELRLANEALRMVYENIVVSGIPGVTNAVPLTEYNQLHYDGFVVIHANQSQPEFQLLTYPNGTGSAVGRNGSSLTSDYNGSPVVSFKPNSAKFGCFISDKTAVAPGVFCVVQVTAYHLDGSQYPTQASCIYSGLGQVQTCTFPGTWTQVGKLSFTVIVSALLTTVGTTIPNLLGSLSPGLGSIGYYLDDFVSVYTCAAGKSVSSTSGLCV
ncbi:hypothetical protein CJF32_00001381 [Rutstroemia sp. NJR-2017a WRK4]|nr:hypothetical protein CJF32_00001381 [Rutstroemia sp. NJR-2017a WRK4]